ncbi:electron transport complex subunit C [Shewanella sp. c952]|uniref:electron transport complex subunit RsxC n=1 Tax=Shewanella sp. c952 TaxID=2815913 RepID=UPI001BBD2427|nr:electron transport complex subunit RsxC [Shewanella sp. c952]GIU12722.1 electron transport complex subunit C [Shewanella sp. c952]
MLTLLEQIDKGTIWRSHGGIHPPELKALSNRTAIETLPLAKQFILPIPQVGDSALLTIKAGDHVLKGQALTVGTSFAHCPVHAPTSGTIAAIKPMPSNHASGLAVLSCILIADGKDEAAETNISDVSALDNQQILKKIQDAGIAGLGGAAFPTHIKLRPASDIELVIINGIECEPYITSDDRLMQEYSDEIIAGIAIIERLLTPKRIIIAIEDNKPEAFEAMQHSLNRSELSSDKTRITSVPTKYPSGGEKQLIQILTGQEVPSGAIPAQLGMLVQNVGTAYAIQDAVINGQPLISRVVTVTGQNSKKPGNYWVPIGTQVDHVLQTNGFKGKLEQDKVIIGGPMMGHSLPDIAAPVLKGTNCILLPSSDEIAPEQPEMPCIRCGECAVACPALLLPQQLFWHAQAQEYDKAASFNLNDCIECGCCSYVCPSDIPLVEYYRVAKSALRTQSEEKKQADFAKQRFDARQQRLEDEKLARENKAKEAAERRKNNMTGTDKNAVAEAMARIKAKKAAEASADNASTEPVQDKKAQVAAAIARAKAKKSLSSETTTTSTETNDLVDDKKAKINAAIARAKAKKVQQTNPADSALIAEASSTAVDDKKAKVAAAIARAKAKKQSQSANVVHNQQLDAVETDAEQASELNLQAEAPLSPEEIKKARIAAAVAKAKAKKAQTTDHAQSTQVDTIETYVKQVSELNSQAEAPLSPEEIKKARIAAAVAKAKAKKAQTTDNAQSTQVDAVETAVEQASELNSQTESPLSAEEIKKARIAAAVAKAKAKKAQTTDNALSTQVDTVKTDVETVQTDAAKPSDVISQTDALQSPEDIKKARVAAAVAKAKAKKAKAKLEEKE